MKTKAIIALALVISICLLVSIVTRDKRFDGAKAEAYTIESVE